MTKILILMILSILMLNSCWVVASGVAGAAGGTAYGSYCTKNPGASGCVIN